MSHVMKRVELAREPGGVPTPDDFALREFSLSEPAAGEVLCETVYLSLDPYMRSQLAGRHISGSIGPGDPMRGETVSRVVSSADPGFAPGDLVRCFGGWATHSLHKAGELSPLGADFPAPSLALSTLGMPGLTAWAGLHCLADIAPGETVVIPAATGGVGAVAGQLARARNCRVIGIAGGEEKCRMAKEKLGYDLCLDRHGPDLGTALDKACPDGITVYFDLVGGPMLNQASARLAIGARVVLCGLMADYNSSERPSGPPPGLWIKARATVYGLVVYDFESRRGEFLDQAVALFKVGKLRGHEDRSQGLESAADAFCRLMRGENQGKVVVCVSDDS